MTKWYNDFAKIGDHVIEGTPLDHAVKGNIVINVKRKPKIVLDENGKIIELYVSQTLIKEFYDNFNEKLPCPYRINQSVLLPNFSTPPTAAMNKGRYFETLCIGGGADGDGIWDLPRNVRTGEKLADQIRIDEAVERFFILAKTTGMILSKDNVQYYHKIRWIDPDYPKSNSGIIIWLDGVADIISPFQHGEWNFPSAVIDIKLTKDRKNKVGKFSWAAPETMDHIQGILYAYLFNMPFLYLVFDYPANNAGEKIFPLNTDINQEDNELRAIAKDRRVNLFQAIRGTVSRILLEEIHGWPKKKSAECDSCPVKSCEYNNKTRII